MPRGNGSPCQSLRQLVEAGMGAESLTSSLCTVDCTRLLIQAQFLPVSPQVSLKETENFIFKPRAYWERNIFLLSLFIQP